MDAQTVAQRIIDAAPAGERSPTALLEGIFGGTGETAVATALSYWALSELHGRVETPEMREVAGALLALLEHR